MRGVQWSEDMLAMLRRMRADGVPIYRCAERIGVGYATAVFKCRELGLADRRNRGRTPGESVQAPRSTSPM